MSRPGPHSVDDRTEEVEDSLVGRLFAGRYDIHAVVGFGAMGGIYKAHQRGMDRWVAVKILHEDLGLDDEVVKRFYREMRATSRIEHPNSIRIYDFGHEQGDLFLVMELLEGRTLEDLMVEEGPLSFHRVARIGAQIASALAGAHKERVVHRDLKPANVLLTNQYGPQDWVKVLDFGLAMMTDAVSDDVTQVGMRVGTPLYMAPEYIETLECDHRADLYALGILLYEMVVGHPPFVGKPLDVFDMHVGKKAPRAALEAPQGCPDWLDELIRRLLRKDPERRPQSAADVARVLEDGAVLESARGKRGDPDNTEEIDHYKAKRLAAAVADPAREGRGAGPIAIALALGVLFLSLTFAALLLMSAGAGAAYLVMSG